MTSNLFPCILTQIGCRNAICSDIKYAFPTSRVFVDCVGTLATADSSAGS